MIKLSVVIPTFNNEELLRAHIKRYEYQTLKKSQYEIIVVNDGGDPLQIDNIRVINLPKNVGPATARNTGAVSMPWSGPGRNLSSPQWPKESKVPSSI